MMGKSNLCKLLFLSIWGFSLFLQSHAADTPSLEVTPVRVELVGNPGDTLVGSITLNNYTPNTLPLTVEPQNCSSSNNNGTPHCQSISQTTTNEEFAEWVNTDISSFSLNSMGQQIVQYSITIPSDATPGGHYGAILFSYTTLGDGSTVLGTIRSIGTIFLLQVNGQVIVDGNVTEIKTDGGGWGNGGVNNTKGLTFFRTIFGSISSLINNPESPTNGEENETQDQNLDNLAEDTDTNTGETEANIGFSITFENNGNTHIKPEGKVEIVDEDGKVIKGIGKEIVYNDLGAVIGDKIVDYLPINDQGGNVLPGTDRKFDIQWQGFPYVDIDDTGKQVIKYKTLGEYYTQENLKGRSEVDLHFWEQLKNRLAQKKLKANITITHKDENGKDIEFNSAKDVFVEYQEQYIGLNIPVISIIGTLSVMILLTWVKIFVGAKTATTAASAASSGIKASKIIAAKTSETYYDILGVKKDASKKEISDAYKKLLKDNKGTKKVEKAHEVLSLKKTRDEYDRKIRK